MRFFFKILLRKFDVFQTGPLTKVSAKFFPTYSDWSALLSPLLSTLGQMDWSAILCGLEKGQSLRFCLNAELGTFGVF